MAWPVDQSLCAEWTQVGRQHSDESKQVLHGDKKMDEFKIFGLEATKKRSFRN